MGIFDELFKKDAKSKNDLKCSECLRPITDSSLKWSGKIYCQECYNRIIEANKKSKDPLEIAETKRIAQASGTGNAVPDEKGKTILSSDDKKTAEGTDMLDDISYIREMKHIHRAWQLYEVLLATRGYGWDYMVDLAAYMESADFDPVSTLTVAQMANMPETELINDYRQWGGTLIEYDKLSFERGQLAIGGISRVLKAPVKIVWFNQTRVLRFFTPINDEQLLTRYIETVIRRTFGTDDAMKLAKPVPPEQ